MVSAWMGAGVCPYQDDPEHPHSIPHAFPCCTWNPGIVGGDVAATIAKVPTRSIWKNGQRVEMSQWTQSILESTVIDTRTQPIPRCNRENSIPNVTRITLMPKFFFWMDGVGRCWMEDGGCGMSFLTICTLTDPLMMVMACMSNGNFDRSLVTYTTRHELQQIDTESPFYKKEVGVRRI